MWFLPLSIDFVDDISLCSDLDYTKRHLEECSSGIGEVKTMVKEEEVSKSQIFEEAAAGLHRIGKKVHDYINELSNKWKGKSEGIIYRSVDGAIKVNFDKIAANARALRETLQKKFGDINVIDAATLAWFISDIVKSPDKTGSALASLSESSVGEVVKDVTMDASVLTAMLTTKDDIARKAFLEDLAMKFGFTSEQTYMLILLMITVKSLNNEDINIAGIDKIVLLGN